MDKIFNIEHQYQLYLDKVQLDESTMHPVQRIETKRAFYAGFGQALTLEVTDTELPGEVEATEAYKHMTDQVKRFWLEQGISKN